MKFKLIIIAGVLFFAINVRSHSVDYTIVRSETVVITAGFGEDSPMNYAGVKVFSPESDKIEFQNGRTDKNGRFSFVPDRAGIWTVSLIDGTGHGLKEEIKIDEAMKLGESKFHGLTVAQKMLVAGSVIWGCIGTALYLRRSRR